MPKYIDRFRYENPGDPENTVTIYANRAGGLYIAVSEERAVDSYNDTFECTAAIDAEQAIQLRDYLNQEFPPLHQKG